VLKGFTIRSGVSCTRFILKIERGVLRIDEQELSKRLEEIEK
jgi:hypothetical protein